MGETFKFPVLFFKGIKRTRGVKKPVGLSNKVRLQFLYSSPRSIEERWRKVLRVRNVRRPSVFPLSFKDMIELI